jgi:Raf kinase inhibitor-like YbhB/YbcL family protein
MRRISKAPFVFCTVLVFSILAVGCQSQKQTDVKQEGGNMQKVQLTSTAFQEGKAIPVQYTCDGENISPPLAWVGIPGGTKSLALIADDPDAPAKTWVHWVIYNIAPGLTELPAGLVKYSSQGGIGVAGKNDFGKLGYGGPCPPKGKPHRYFFKIYALDTELDLQQGATKAQLEVAMQAHILAQGQLMSTYSR